MAWIKRIALIAVAWVLEGVDAVAAGLDCEPVRFWANERWGEVVAKLDQVVNAPP